MLVLVATPGSALPVELQNEVMVIDEPLPSVEDRSGPDHAAHLNRRAIHD